MDDVIYRQAAIDVVHKSIFDFFNICDDDEESEMTHQDKELLKLNKAITTQLKAVPSAQPEIIRCKDCKYNCFNAEAGIAKCCMFHAKTNLYGFCYLGERRTDETD